MPGKIDAKRHNAVMADILRVAGNPRRLDAHQRAMIGHRHNVSENTVRLLARANGVSNMPLPRSGQFGFANNENRRKRWLGED